MLEMKKARHFDEMPLPETDSPMAIVLQLPQLSLHEQKARWPTEPMGAPRMGSNSTGVVVAWTLLLSHTECRSAAHHIFGFEAMAFRSVGTS
jgi:hypothetical protein